MEIMKLPQAAQPQAAASSAASSTASSAASSAAQQAAGARGHAVNSQRGKPSRNESKNQLKCFFP